uniref:Uncharacterized protein n=1 Tax=Hucho hucho TaxID=62062 RepID=A0A4W5P0E9_9TELE
SLLKEPLQYEVCDRAVMIQPNVPAKWNPRILYCCIDSKCRLGMANGCLPLLPTTMMMILIDDLAMAREIKHHLG